MTDTLAVQGSQAPVRVRRPREHADLMDELTAKDQPFSSYRDMLGFAAALGWSLGKRTPFPHSAEPIAWSVFVNHPGNEALVDMLTAADSEDPDALSSANLKNRITAFEEYAKTGLDALAQMRGSTSSLEAFTQLVMQHERESDGPDIDALMSELSNL